MSASSVPTVNIFPRSTLLQLADADALTLVTLTFDLLTLKVLSELCMTWATSVPILVFLGLSVLDLGPINATDVRQASDVRQHHRLAYDILIDPAHAAMLSRGQSYVFVGG